MLRNKAAYIFKKEKALFDSSTPDQQLLRRVVVETVRSESRFAVNWQGSFANE